MTTPDEVPCFKCETLEPNMAVIKVTINSNGEPEITDQGDIFATLCSDCLEELREKDRALIDVLLAAGEVDAVKEWMDNDIRSIYVEVGKLVAFMEMNSPDNPGLPKLRELRDQMAKDLREMDDDDDDVWLVME